MKDSSIKQIKKTQFNIFQLILAQVNVCFYRAFVSAKMPIMVLPLKNERRFRKHTSRNAGYNSCNECSFPSVSRSSEARSTACLNASASEDFERSRASFAAF